MSSATWPGSSTTWAPIAGGSDASRTTSRPWPTATSSPSRARAPRDPGARGDRLPASLIGHPAQRLYVRLEVGVAHGLAPGLIHRDVSVSHQPQHAKGHVDTVVVVTLHRAARHWTSAVDLRSILQLPRNDPQTTKARRKSLSTPQHRSWRVPVWRTQEESRPPGQRQHDLPDRHPRGQDPLDQMAGALCHPSAATRWSEPAAAARKGHEAVVVTGGAVQVCEAIGERAAPDQGLKLSTNEARDSSPRAASWRARMATSAPQVRPTNPSK